MATEDYRTIYWHKLRAALMASKEAHIVKVRDAFLGQANEWAQTLAETAVEPEPREQTYFLDTAMADIGDKDWSIPLYAEWP